MPLAEPSRSRRAQQELVAITALAALLFSPREPDKVLLLAEQPLRPRAPVRQERAAGLQAPSPSLLVQPGRQRQGQAGLRVPSRFNQPQVGPLQALAGLVELGGRFRFLVGLVVLARAGPIRAELVRPSQ